MKFKLAVAFLLTGGLAALWSNQSAEALPVFRTEFEDYYIKKMNDQEMTAAFAEAKCNVCHYGKSKKNHNDYGLALKKFLKKDDYKFTRLKQQPEQVKQEIHAAFKKVEEMKSSNGKTFGELLKAGELPGTAPEGAEESAE